MEPQRIIVLDKRSNFGSDKYLCIDEVYSYEQLQGNTQTGDEHATAYLCYSSGTTGRAKGVETSHHNMTSQLQALNLVYQPLKSDRDVVLGILPFSHIYGMPIAKAQLTTGLTVVIHQPLTVGVPVVVLPRFEEIPVLEAIQRYRITWGLVVPPILIVLLHSKQVNKYDLGSLVGLQSGAAPLGVELIRAFEDRHGIPITQGYGLTETSPVTHVMTTDEATAHPGQIGRLMPTFECRLVDSDSGKDVEAGERGEMWLRGPSVMKGYWRNREATDNTFAPGGWFKTGDVAIVDQNGYYS
jgi:acyl-CoA synthetase (AMP-forming)/AMP-acid ligase II